MDFPAVLHCAADFPAPNRIYNDRLAALRAQYPFVSIQPPPVSVLAVYLDAGQAREVQFPDGTQMIRFTANAAPVYVTFQGKAQIPASGNDLTRPGVLVNPDGWYYVAELRQVSIIAPVDAIVSLHCHVQV